MGEASAGLVVGAAVFAAIEGVIEAEAGPGDVGTVVPVAFAGATCVIFIVGPSGFLVPRAADFTVFDALGSVPGMMFRVPSNVEVPPVCTTLDLPGLSPFS